MKTKKIIATLIILSLMTSLVGLYVKYKTTPTNIKAPIKTQVMIPLNEYKIPKKLQNNERLYLGKMNYKLRCQKCHGANGGGGPKAPSILTNWKYGNGSYQHILKITSEGTPSRKMYGWDQKLLPSDIENIAAYVITLIHQNQTVGK